jgi:hypothetical protein
MAMYWRVMTRVSRTAMRMRTKTCVAAAVLAGAFAFPGAASAAVVECGNYGADDYGDVGWTYGEISGAGIFNVTTRRVGCRTARKFVLSWNGNGRYRGYRCRYVSQAYEFADIRCTASRGRVIRWQTGA